MHLNTGLCIAFPSWTPYEAIRTSRLVEEESVEVRSVNLGMTPGTGAIEKCPGSLVMGERGVTVAFQTEHSFFPSLQEKFVRRSVRHVTDRAPLDAPSQMFEGEWSAFLYMAPRAGLVLYTP
jgi:hypothetical protein